MVFTGKELGQEGERVAADYLVGLHFEVLERNYRTRLGEIDLIVRRGDRLLFVEVKTRHSFQKVSPLELIPRQKQLHISKVAQHYIARKRITDLACEFALVIVDYSGEHVACELLEGIFMCSWGY